MKIERVILFTVLVAVIFVATIVLFFFKTFSPGPNQNQNPPVFTQPTKPATTTNPTATSTQPAADNHTALDDCIELKAFNAQGKSYEKGSLLVTFPNSVNFSTAIEIIDIVGAKTDTSSAGRDNFNSHHWLTVTVPKGEEFKWQCLLEGADGVRKANLNFTFNLAQ